MNMLDLIIILVIVLAVIRGVRLGAVRQGLSVAGFFSGLFIGSLLAPLVTSLSHDSVMRIILTLITTIGLAIIVSGLGEWAGQQAKHLAIKLHLNSIDAALGAGLEAIFVLLTAWLVVSPLSSLHINSLGREIRQSRIIQALDKALPPAPDTIAKLVHLIEPNGFPKVFIGPEPSPTPSSPPPPAEVQAAVAQDRASVVKIEGSGCGGLVEGSGFVAYPGLVATNAHVVAGIRNPVIIDSNGRHRATPVYFDLNLDFAVLRANGLAGTPLVLDDTEVASGTTAAVLGFPGGGPFSAAPASIIDEITAVGRNIYGAGITRRRVYEINADVQPGNSGGPLVDTSGTVIGVVFAKSEDNDGVGYTLTSPEVLPGLHQAQSSGAVGTGTCSTG